MSSRGPKVSVCLPVYNGANYLAESMTSVLTQTYEDYRLIVVDNCSTDATPDIVAGFKDRRIVYHRNAANLGLVGNHNRCLELAGGEYVCIWHHDDVMLPTNLEEKVGTLDRLSTVGFVHSNLWTIDARGRTLARQHWSEDSRRDYVRPGLEVFRRCLECLHREAVVFLGSVMARRACYQQIGGFRPELPNYCDCEIVMRMTLFYDVACLGTPLVKYRLHSESVSSATPGPAWVAQGHAAARMIFDRFGARIPGLETLRRDTRRRFARETLYDAANASYSGDFNLSRRYLTTAVRQYPEVLGKGSFWRLALRWAAGRYGTQLFERIRSLGSH